MEEGEKPTQFFHNLEKYHAKNKTWTKILNGDNTLVYGTNEIMNVQVDFYKKNYILQKEAMLKKENFLEII